MPLINDNINKHESVFLKKTKQNKTKIIIIIPNLNDRKMIMVMKDN